ncbi:MAG: hypothetical protein R6X23_09090 [Acidimicrobiia bacterium]
MADYYDDATVGRPLGEADDDRTFTYDWGGGCPDEEAFYTDGILHRTFPNVAVIDQTGQQDDASVEMTCYIPTVSKDATATYVERHDWSIAKSVTPEAQSGFLGDILRWSWTIDVDERVVDQEFLVTGTIYVTNPSPMSVDAKVEDFLGDIGTPGVVDCDEEADGAQDTLTILPASTGMCTYVVEAADATDTYNVASVVLPYPSGYEYVAQVDVRFEKIVENDTATLTDTELGLSVALTEPYLKSFSGQHVCSSDLADYEASGSYSGSVSNTATLVDKELSAFSDTTTTSYACYVPSIEKTAAGTYDERHEWSVEKTVDPTSQAAFIGDTVYFDWTITVFEDVFEENFDVSGTITVSNPNPEDALVVPLTDFVDGVAATIDARPPGRRGTCRGLQVAPRLPFLEQIAELATEKLHAAPRPSRTWPSAAEARDTRACGCRRRGAAAVACRGTRPAPHTSGTRERGLPELPELRPGQHQTRMVISCCPPSRSYHRHPPRAWSREAGRARSSTATGRRDAISLVRREFEPGSLRFSVVTPRS